MNVLCMFVKFPEKEKVKTRLAKDVGDEEAVKIYVTILKKLIEYHKNQNYEFIIALSPKEKKFEFKKMFPEINLLIQEGDNLGEKIRIVFDKLLKQYKKVIVIGSDCPLVNESVITGAFENLKENEIVIGPAEDGGYYLIGMNKFIDLFDSISWSTEKVLEQTLKKIDNKQVSLLKILRDVDTSEDYEFYVKRNIL